MKGIIMLAALLAGNSPAECQPKVTMVEHADRVDVLLDGELFAAYVFRGYPRPMVYPIIGPHRIGMTRNFPMKTDVLGEPQDHPHHKSMYFGYGSVNGVNFFADHAEAGRIVHEKFLEIRSDAGRGVVKPLSQWVTADGQVVCTDTRTITFHTVDGVRAIDWEVTILASEGDVTFQDDKHGSMVIRMHPNLQLDSAPTANGQAVNSEGISGKAVFGQRAKWIDYWGTIDDKTVGIAIFDHPSNPRHPTWWMARGYGYVAADPFGGHSIGGEPPGTGDMTIESGEKVTFRYRYLFHEGDPEHANIAGQYARFAENALPSDRGR